MNYDYDEIWQSVLGELELLISKASFTTWFKNTYIIKIDSNNILIAVPNGFTKRWLENKYNENILTALNNVIKEGEIKTLEFTISHNKPEIENNNSINIKDIGKKILEQDPQEKTEPVEYVNNSLTLNPKYTFENFITGKQNELAKAASTAVSKNPGRVYNPLFLYGEVGLGKTHLMQSIANHIKEKFPKYKLAYISSEHFTNEYIKSIQSGKIDNFKKKYRELDVLLVDDIQFMKGQERTQEEFFHTFNNLYQQNKQIVISSDRPPKSLPAIEQRLTSRFESGMIADIGHPDLETRVAILKSKIQEKNINLQIPENAISQIAEIAKSNVRELEGALNRVIAIHQLNNQKVTVESIKDVLGGIVIKQKENALTTKKIIKIVSEHFDISTEDITGNCRRKELVNPRQICMYLMRTELNRSYPSIGQEMGGRDHTTAIHGSNKVLEDLKTNERIKEDIDLIKQKLKE
ncbi:MAG: chromosomal replication initiator protein DnaA [Patescibacteria group bacterium]|nr:chromosomal replication initiator protein DnaA [Patescibacteria group bacterium]MDD4304656.1 chromosomal replication initiator protein DnaA [Patescibacteria group bacterium]MDD4695703.1 chromosomal replication initiator protein DnaA [Patescibacteria group bacterium]